MIFAASIFVALQCFMLAPNAVFAYHQSSAYYGGKEYAYFVDGHDTVSYIGAIFGCPAWRAGSELAQARTEGINNAVTESTKPNCRESWIGAADSYGDGIWRWLDGDRMSFGSWDSGEPNGGGGENCCQTNHDGPGLWNDEGCGDSMGFVCEIAQTRIQPLDHSTLTFHEVPSPITFADAQTSCKNFGARLVKIENEKAKEILSQKMSTIRTMYWVDDAEVGCLMLNKEKSEEESCDKLAGGYVCETARPHNVQVSDESPTVNKAENLEITCSVSGFPLPDVAWYKDEQLVENQSIGEASATLKITNANKNDGGLYICRAYNGSTKSSGLSHVTVAANEN